MLNETAFPVFTALMDQWVKGLFESFMNISFMFPQPKKNFNIKVISVFSFLVSILLHFSV